MSARLIIAVVSTLLEEAALVAIVLWGLPQIDINVPLPGLIIVMVAWAVFAVYIYRMGSRALRRKPVVGLVTMVGSRGKVVNPLAPHGLIKIKDEIWEAQSAGDRLKVGDEVTVVGQDGLKLVVRKDGKKDLSPTK